MTKTIPEWQAELHRLADKNGGCLQPEKVVQAARSPKSPLHSKFTWDDSEAAQQYRLWQARQLIRVVVTVVPHTNREDCVWVSLKSDRNGTGYRPLVSVLSDSDLREQLLQEAKEEFAVFQRKYGQLKELAKVFEAMQEVE